MLIGENARRLQGFAWYVRKRPGPDPPGLGEHPFEGLDAEFRPHCWPIGPGGAGVRNRGTGPAFLVVTPTVTFGPPEVGRAWQIEPAELDGFRTEDGRIRLVDMEPLRTQWGTVAECVFEDESQPTAGPFPRLRAGASRLS